MARGNRKKSQGRATICPLCGNPVRDTKTAILERETGDPAHFDCVAQRLAETENLSADERITYLGKGSFGVVTQRNASGPVRFLISRRIQYEDAEKRAKWRAAGRVMPTEAADRSIAAEPTKDAELPPTGPDHKTE